MPRPNRFTRKAYAMLDTLNSMGMVKVNEAIGKLTGFMEMSELEAAETVAYWILFNYRARLRKPKPVDEPKEEEYGFRGWAPPGYMTCPTCKGFGVLGDRNDHTTWKRCPTCECKEIVVDPNWKKGGGESEEPKG